MLRTGRTDIQVDLTWVDSSTNELSFRIERSTTNITFTTAGTTGANATGFSDTLAPPSTRIFYRVIAVNNVGDSLPSNVVDVTTAPARPTGLTITRAEPGRIEMTWNDNSNAEGGFRVQRATDDAFTQNVAENTLPPNTTRFRDETITTGVTFWYRVVAFSAAATSGASNVV